MMDKKSWKRIETMEQGARFPTGIGQIERGNCPTGARLPTACMLCTHGHMLECHYPYTCEEAECLHYRTEIKQEGGLG